MDIKSRKAWSLALSFMFATGFGFLAALVHERQTEHLDKSIMKSLYANHSGSLTSVMKVYSFLGSEWMVSLLVVVISALFYFLLKFRWKVLYFISVVAGSVLLNQALKTMIHRNRPELQRLVDASGNSFPSGQSMAALALYGIIMFLLWRHLSSSFMKLVVVVLCSGMMVFIGISRVYLGVHYPTDVLAGYLASGAWLCASIWLYYRCGAAASK